MSIATTSYVLDSRQRAAGSTVSAAIYNLAALGSPVESGTYEVLSFNSRNNVYNVDDSNDEIYFDEGGAELGPVLIPHGYYTTEAALAAAVKIVMDAVSGTTYTIAFSALTNLYLFTPAAGTLEFNWGTNSAQPQANLLLGFTAVDTGDAATQSSDIGVDLDPHSNLLVQIVEDGLKNVTLISGLEFSLIIPLTSPYGDQFDGLKTQTFNQTVNFASSMNQLTVSLFTENGVVLPELNAAQYTLILRRVF